MEVPVEVTEFIERDRRLLRRHANMLEKIQVKEASVYMLNAKQSLPVNGINSPQGIAQITYSMRCYAEAAESVVLDIHVGAVDGGPSRVCQTGL